MNTIESIQKQFMKFIDPNSSSNNPENQFELRPYATRCKEMKILTLTRRRINACIFLIHDIISGRINSPKLRAQLSFAKINYFTRSPEFIKLNTCRLDCTDQSSFRMACWMYNVAALLVDVTIERESFRRQILNLRDSIFISFLGQ